jgi:hypothetical protein
MMPPASRIPRGVVRAFLGGLLMLSAGAVGELIVWLSWSRHVGTQAVGVPYGRAGAGHPGPAWCAIADSADVCASLRPRHRPRGGRAPAVLDRSFRCGEATHQLAMDRAHGRESGGQ